MRAFAVAAVLAASSWPVAAADGWAGCYARAYEVGHLAAHPRQTVTSMTLRLFPATGDDPNASEQMANLGATFSTRNARMFADGGCHAEDKAMVCAIDNDGGKFRLTKAPNGILLEVVGSLQMHKATEEARVKALGPDNPEDRKFVLAPVPDETCLRDLDDLEPS